MADHFGTFYLSHGKKNNLWNLKNKIRFSEGNINRFKTVYSKSTLNQFKHIMCPNEAYIEFFYIV